MLLHLVYAIVFILFRWWRGNSLHILSFFFLYITLADYFTLACNFMLVHYFTLVYYYTIANYYVNLLLNICVLYFTNVLHVGKLFCINALFYVNMFYFFRNWRRLVYHFLFCSTNLVMKKLSRDIEILFHQI